MSKDHEDRPFLTERLVARLWRNRDPRRTLKTRDGGLLRVLYPGRLNGGPGPDFKDALLQMDGVEATVRGDIEIHKESAGWNQHGHQEDPRYNNVVLHVVYRASEQRVVRRQDGRAVPTAELRQAGIWEGEEESPTDGERLSAAWLGEWQRMPLEELARALDVAGQERFLERSVAFHRSLDVAGAEELMYCGIMEALGYSRNREPFRDLARRVPWGMVQDTARRLSPAGRSGAIYGLLLWAAGLSGQEYAKPVLPPVPLPGHISAHEKSAGINHLERQTAWLRAVPRMNASSWSVAGVRPQNHPRRRIAGAAELLARYVDAGLVGPLREIVEAESPARVRDAMAVTQDKGTLIGKDRALDIVVNVVLPLLHAIGRARGDGKLEKAALRTYTKAPKLADNEITREMTSLLGERARGLIRSAARQQGLMHRYNAQLREGVWWGYLGGISTGKVLRERSAPYAPSSRIPVWVRGFKNQPVKREKAA